MEKYVVRYSFWLGLVCAAIALIWRGFNAIGLYYFEPVAVGQSIYYMSFYKAALLFLLVSVAAANYAWYQGRRL